MATTIRALTKSCNKCLEVKALEEFGRKPTGRYGREAKCKQCRAEARSQIGTDKGRIDQTIRVNYRIKAALKEDARRLGLTERDLGGFALAAGLRAIREGKLKLPEQMRDAA